MPSVDVDDATLARIVRQAIQVAIARSRATVRTPQILTGTVEDLDDENHDVAFVRLDDQAMSSDPTQSDNWDNPGVLAMTPLGQATVDEQVRVTFSGQFGGEASRTGFAGVDVRLDVDSTQGIIRFLAGELLVGYMDVSRWELGVPGESLARIDPFGGLRLRDENDVLRAQLSAPEGLILRRAATGVSGAILADDGLIVIDPDTGDRLSITSGTTSSAPTPHWVGSKSETGDATHSTPAVTTFGTGDDIDLRFVSASAAANLAASSYTPPTNYTERADEAPAGSSGFTLASSCATRDPAITTPGAQSFTNTLSTWTRENGHSVIIRGGGGISPAFRSASVLGVQTFTTANFSLSITEPTGTTTGDIGIAHVSIVSAKIPIGWTVPPGWKQLGVQVAGLGTSHVLGSGIWYKQIEASDPSTFSVSINMSGAGTTKVTATAVAVSDPYAFPVGLDIRRNNRSMPRGLERSVVQTTNTATFTTTGNTDLDTNNAGGNIDMIAGRTYWFNLLLPRFQWFGGTVASEWQIRLRKDDTTDVGVFGVFAWPGTLNYAIPLTSSFQYVPTANENARWTVRFTEISGDANVQATASATAPRRLDIVDMGATF